MAMDRVTTFTNSDIVVSERICNPKEIRQGQMPAMKKIYLSKENPLKAAGVDYFEVQTRDGGRKIVSAVSKDGKRLATNWMGGGKPVCGNLKSFIKALKTFALKVRI